MVAKFSALLARSAVWSLLLVLTATIAPAGAAPPPRAPALAPSIIDAARQAPITDRPVAPQRPTPIDRETAPTLSEGTMSALSSGDALPDGSGSPWDFAIEGFETDLFTGGVTAAIPIRVPAGAAGVAPRIVLRYRSRTAGDLPAQQQAPWTGLGWALDVGGFIFRDTRGTTALGDDRFWVVLNGARHDLVLVDAINNVYHTKYETGVRVVHDLAADAWTLTTQDGTAHRFGANDDSRAIGQFEDTTTQAPYPAVYKYFLDRVTTTSGVAIIYTYDTYVASVSAGYYDQAVYPAQITWAFTGATPIGPLREVRFLREARTDWTDTSTSTQKAAYFERDRLAAIEVRVGGSLVRRYDLTHDYSVDRDATHTWGGGATGDLTLKSLKPWGLDYGLPGAVPLPSMTFSYSGPVLATANNGIGGSVSYGYEHAEATVPLSEGCTTTSPSSPPQCAVTGATTAPVGDFPASLIGYLAPPDNTMLGGIAVYETCLLTYSGYCMFRGTTTDPNLNPSWAQHVGYLAGQAWQGMAPIYQRCLVFAQGQCWATGLSNSGAPNETVGYLYKGWINLHRADTRTVADGKGWSATTTFGYQDLALSADGSEFRGHRVVTATDPVGNVTTTQFLQDDTYKGRFGQSDTKDSGNAVWSQTWNTWTSSTPAPGVTLVSLTRKDTSTCGVDGCRNTAMWFEFNADGNVERRYSFGDTAVGGDEWDERIEWVVDGDRWIHRPRRVTLYAADGTTLRERWLSYDGMPWGQLGARGLLTHEEARLNGGAGTPGNPVTTYSYNAYGNPATVTDPRGCSTTTTYHPSQAHPATVTNCLQHSVTLAWDERFGVPTSVTDPNTQTTTYVYDVYGRLGIIQRPEDGTSTVSVHGMAPVALSKIWWSSRPDAVPVGV